MNSLYLPPAVAVQPDDRQTWQQALIRAQERLLGCVFRRTLRDHDTDVDFYLVESHSTPGKQHSVAIWTDDEDVVWARCGCGAGQFGTICQHMALVINRARRWGELPILSQQPLVSASELHVGVAVRVKKTGRAGTISYVTLVNGRDFLFSVQGPREAHVGVFLASELERVDAELAVAS